MRTLMEGLKEGYPGPVSPVEEASVLKTVQGGFESHTGYFPRLRRQIFDSVVGAEVLTRNVIRHRTSIGLVETVQI